jgi:hypothetical protein
MTATGNRTDFEGELFRPKEYNRTYYSEVMQDEAFLIEWQAGPLDQVVRAHLAARNEDSYARQFDAGCGPAVHHLFALEKYVRRIDLADFLPQNRAEIRGWVEEDDPDAHDWTPFIRAILIAEGIEATAEAVDARAAAVRRKVASYSPIDFRMPLEDEPVMTAPLVTSFFVADSATAETEMFVHMTMNAFKSVEPGGLFVGAYLGGCSEYLVGDDWFPSAEVKAKDIEDAFSMAGASTLCVW